VASPNRQQSAAVGLRETNDIKKTPTANFGDVVFGFYALNGTCVVDYKDNLSKEYVGDFCRKIWQKNPERLIIIVCDNFSSQFTEYIDNIVIQLDLIYVVLMRYSSDPNPIEQI
jgi:hypothetical protein